METKETVETTEMPGEKELYLKGLVGELMGDQEWPFPQQLRFFLVADLEWTLLSL